MKLFFTLFFGLLTLVTSAQGLPADPASGKVVYTGDILHTGSVNQQLAFGRAKMWLNAVTTKGSMVEDAASGMLSGTGLVKVKQFDYTFRIRLQVIAGDIHYRLEDFAWHEGVDQGTPEAQRDSKLAMGKASRARILTELDSKVRASLAQLQSELGAAL
jgi:hypothetical protein